MGTISRSVKAGGSTNIADGQTAVAADVNTDMNTAYTEINGFLDDGNIETATIPGAKSLRFTEISDPSSPSSGDQLLFLATNSALKTLDSSGRTYRYGAVIDSVITDVATGANTTETTLWSKEVGSSLLSENGQSISFVFQVFFANNANDKTIRVKFGATTILTDTTTDTTGSTWATYWGTVWRDAAGSQTGYAFRTSTSAMVGGTTYTGQAPAETLSGSVTFAVTGQNGTASANDIILGAARLIWYPN